MIAIFQEIILGFGTPSIGVQNKAVNHIIGEFQRDTAFPRHHAKGIKGRLAGLFPAMRAPSEHSCRGNSLFGVGDGRHPAAKHLAIGKIITFAPPRIKQPDAFTGFFAKQLGGRRERL